MVKTGIICNFDFNTIKLYYIIIIIIINKWVGHVTCPKQMPTFKGSGFYYAIRSLVSDFSLHISDYTFLDFFGLISHVRLVNPPKRRNFSPWRLTHPLSSRVVVGQISPIFVCRVYRSDVNSIYVIFFYNFLIYRHHECVLRWMSRIFVICRVLAAFTRRRTAASDFRPNSNVDRWE